MAQRRGCEIQGQLLVPYEQPTDVDVGHHRLSNDYLTVASKLGDGISPFKAVSAAGVSPPLVLRMS